MANRDASMVKRGFSRKLTTLAAGLLVVLFVPSAVFAGHHQWDISEVFSDESGTIQFVELFSSNPNEAGLGPFFLTSASGGSVQFVTDLPGDTVNTWVLVGTTGFAALPGAPTPDYTLPDNFADPTGDTVFYAGMADTLQFASLPTNGVDSIDDMLVASTNSPTNFAGVMGTVTVPEPSGTALLAAALLTLISLGRLRK
jgi:hypothetical protein